MYVYNFVLFALLHVIVVIVVVMKNVYNSVNKKIRPQQHEQQTKAVI